MATAPRPPLATNFFERSYRDYEQYPTNLVYRSSYRKVLESYKKRLDNASAKLFYKEGGKAQLDVRFRDYDDATKQFVEVKKNEIENLSKLKAHLGDASSSAGFRFTKQDPKCRYISICSDINRMPLLISRTMTNILFSFHQVMPGYLDFLSTFGLQLDQREVRFSGFHQQNTLSIPQSKKPAVLALGRSGHGYQLCYNIKTIVDKGGSGKLKDWSKRQAAVHHQFDGENGNALWICTEGRKVDGLFDRMRDLTQDSQRPQDWSYGSKSECFRSSLATHLICCHWSIEEWRTYVSWLEEVIENETRSAVDGNRTREKGTVRKTYTPQDLMLVQGYEDQTSEVITILEANNDVMLSLSTFYDNLMKNTSFDAQIRTDCEDDVFEFVAQIADMIYDANMQLRRARLLVKLTADRKALILQHLQSQNTEAMANLTYMSYNEAIIMRIITVVTLIYLPATFVSTFFSTDVVKYQGQDGQGSFSSVALYRWLEVTLPLSAVTILAGYAWYRRQKSKSKRKGYVLPY